MSNFVFAKAPRFVVLTSFLFLHPLRTLSKTVDPKKRAGNKSLRNFENGTYHQSQSSEGDALSKNLINFIRQL